MFKKIIYLTHNLKDSGNTNFIRFYFITIKWKRKETFFSSKIDIQKSLIAVKNKA